MRDYLWSFANSFFVRGFSAVFSVVLGNFLLPHELGIFISLKLVTDYISQFAHFQLGAGVVQKINDVNLSDKRDNYFSAGLMSTLLIGVSATLLLYIFFDVVVESFRLQGYENLLLFISPFILLYLVVQYFSGVLRADLKFKTLAGVTSSATLIQLVLGVAFLVLGYKLFELFLSLYVGRLVAVILLGVSCFRRNRLVVDGTTVDAAKDLLKFSGLIYLGSVAVFLDTRMDLFFINYFLMKKEVAVYNYAVEIMLLFLMFGNSISRVTFPKLSRAFTSSASEEVNILYSRCLNFSFLILSVLSLFLLFHAEYLIRLILPAVYLEMIPALTILVLGIVLFATFASVGTIFTAKGIPGYGTLAIWICLFVNLVLNILLIPRYGLIGAAVATSTSFGLRVVIGMVLVEYKIRTDYNYFRLAGFYGLLIGIVVLSSFVLSSLLVKEILLLGFMGGSFLFLLGDRDRQYLRRLFSGPVYAKTDSR
jgi:O-antigen/teichoic acid export membrane protein